MAKGPVLNIEREVAFGESREEAIVRRWLKHSKTAKNASRIIGSGTFDDFDFWVLSQNGFPICWLEVKQRTIDFAKYGDAMYPYRKHEYAKRLLKLHNLTVYGVTEYACGALVEVDLSTKPAVIKQVARRDRPGIPPVKHGLYSRAQMTLVTS